jgi:ferredoxin
MVVNEMGRIKKIEKRKKIHSRDKGREGFSVCAVRCACVMCDVKAESGKRERALMSLFY